ncbi:DUF2383 domain-containing protein [Vibrio parahaemolyticus]|uniref:DUF2383 domain-containing protein n=1 Tax=Vibrio parahaemolyticus TaxID=670 RepID=UPI003B5AF4CE
MIFLFDLPISIRPRSGLKGSDRWLTERFHRFGQQRLANPQTADDTPVSYTIKAREVYSDVMKEVSSDKESMYLEQLEGVESKVLKEIENVITAQPEQADNAVLLKVRSDIKSCKEKLSNISLIS